MTSRFVMANIKMPIEIKPDNTIVPLQHLSNVYVVSIIDSINDIIIDRSLPDIVSQARDMFEKRLTISSLHSSPHQIDEHIMQDVGHEEQHKNSRSVSQQIWIRPEELRKTPPQFKKNTSFKNRGKYSNRFTAKTRYV
jgi:hypothetical protein